MATINDQKVSVTVKPPCLVTVLSSLNGDGVGFWWLEMVEEARCIFLRQSVERLLKEQEFRWEMGKARKNLPFKKWAAMKDCARFAFGNET